MTEAELVGIVNALLGEGVPPGIVARVFGLDEELVKQQLKTVRVERYGTADLESYMEATQWEVIDEARRTLVEGTAAEKARVMTMFLSKGIAAASRRVPDSVKEGREQLTATLEAMRTGEPPAPPRRSPFVAIEGGNAGA